MSEIGDLPSTASTSQPASFAKEEWEGWMKWDGPFESLSANSPQHSPPPLQYVSGSLGSTSPSEFDSLPPIAFTTVYSLSTTESKKRKSSAIDGAGTTMGTGRQPRGKKISHNVIEKRYRSNLNDKIAKLRDSVPELRSAPPTIKRRPQKAVASDSEGSGDEASQGLKFNKATVLIKATEYIQQLERQNQRLLAEVSTLRNRNGSKHQLQTPPVISTAVSKPLVDSIGVSQTSLEKSTDWTQGENDSAKDESKPAAVTDIAAKRHLLSEEVSAQDHCAARPLSSGVDVPSAIPPWSEVKGMIPLPESWQRFRARSKPEGHYAPSSPISRIPELEDPPFNDGEGGSRWSKSRMMSRVLVGSLAGLMIMEGLNERDEDSSQLQKRGLFSLPNELLTESRGFRVPIRRRIIAFASSSKARQALPVLGFSFVFLLICFAVFLYSIPEASKAIREGPILEDEEVNESSPNGNGSSLSSPTSESSELLTSSNLSAQKSSTVGEFYALKLIHWFGLSWLISPTHDEEAAGRTNLPMPRRERWLSYLHVIPKFGEDFPTS